MARQLDFMSAEQPVANGKTECVYGLAGQRIPLATAYTYKSEQPS